MNKLTRILDKIFVSLCIILIVICGGYLVFTFFTANQQNNIVQGEIAEWSNLPVVNEQTAEGSDNSEEVDINFDDNSKLWGTVEIPSQGILGPISAISDWELLWNYVVPFANSDLPEVSGGNYSLASHWGGGPWCSYCYFRDIDQLKIGDQIIITDRSNIYTYQLYKNPQVVMEDEVEVLDRIEGQTTLTLITCVQADDPRRTVVHAKLIAVEPRG
ncbi:MAG: sortase [Erysipelotrichaceae bacterium]